MSDTRMDAHNAQRTCWNCPAADIVGKVDFTACGQAREKIEEQPANPTRIITVRGAGYRFDG